MKARRDIALVCALGIGAAAPAHGLTLLESYRAALSHDSIMQSAEAQHRGGVEVVSQAKSALGPTVQLAGSAAWVRSSAVLGLPATTGNTEQAGLTLTQPLYHRADWTAWDQAEFQAKGVDAQLVGARQTLYLRTAQAYFNVLLATESLDVTRKEREAIAQQVAQAKRSFQVGTVTITDVSDSQSRFDLSAAQEIQYQSDLEVAKHALEHITGIPAENLAGLSAGAVVPPTPDDIQYWLQAAEAGNPTVVQAHATLNSQQLEAKHAGAATWPTFDLVAGATTSRYSTPDIYYASTTGGRSATVGVQMTWPLWDSGMRNSRVRQAIAGADQAQDDLTTSRLGAVQSARQAYLGVKTSISQIQALGQATASAQTSLDATTRGKEVGYRTQVDVLNALQFLYQAQQQQAAARYTAVLDLLQLKALAGMLTERDLDGLTGR